MKVDSFKEILMKKSQDNNSLRSFIYHISDDHLVNYVMQSLEKMAAKPGQSKHPNSKVIQFASNLPTYPKMTKMLHDHLSHHATRYKAALKAGDQRLAGQHMNRIFKSLHLIDKMINDGHQNHTTPNEEIRRNDPDAEIAINTHNTKWVCPKPWERNHYIEKKKEGGHPSSYSQDHYSTHTKGLSRDLNEYPYLQKAPHHSYAKEVNDPGHRHAKAWPLEETKFNGRYLNIDDNHKSSGRYEEHPMDEHPIFSIYNTSDKSLTPEAANNYDSKEVQWFQKYLSNPNSYITEAKKNPNVGMQKPSQVHADVEPLDHEYHVKTGKSLPVQTVESGISGDEARARMREILQQRSGGRSTPPPVPSPAEDDGQMSMNLGEPSDKKRG